MQAKVRDEEHPKRFYPFTLEIRIESLEELANLWCRLNCSGREIKELNERYSAGKIMNSASASNTVLWEVVNIKANELNIGTGI